MEVQNNCLLGNLENSPIEHGNYTLERTNNYESEDGTYRLPVA